MTKEKVHLVKIVVVCCSHTTRICNEFGMHLLFINAQILNTKI